MSTGREERNNGDSGKHKERCCNLYISLIGMCHWILLLAARHKRCMVASLRHYNISISIA